MLLVALFLITVTWIHQHLVLSQLTLWKIDMWCVQNTHFFLKNHHNQTSLNLISMLMFLKGGEKSVTRRQKINFVRSHWKPKNNLQNWKQKKRKNKFEKQLKYLSLWPEYNTEPLCCEMKTLKSRKNKTKDRRREKSKANKFCLIMRHIYEVSGFRNALKKREKLKSLPLMMMKCGPCSLTKLPWQFNWDFALDFKCFFSYLFIRHRIWCFCLFFGYHENKSFINKYL